MAKKGFFLGVCLAVLVGLAACGSRPAANNSVAGGAGPGPDMVSTSKMVAITPNPSDVIILDNTNVTRALWTISSYVIGKNSSMDETSAQAYLFKSLDINDTEITFDGKACQGVTFQQSTVNAADYLSSTWKTTPSELGIDVTELQVFKTNCGLSGFQEYMRLGDGRLIVPINGVFFFFQPAVTQ